jgi:hypothetical protein
MYFFLYSFKLSIDIYSLSLKSGKSFFIRSRISFFRKRPLYNSVTGSFLFADVTGGGIHDIKFAENEVKKK